MCNDKTRNIEYIICVAVSHPTKQHVLATKQNIRTTKRLTYNYDPTNTISIFDRQIILATRIGKTPCDSVADNLLFLNIFSRFVISFAHLSFPSNGQLHPSWNIFQLFLKRHFRVQFVGDTLKGDNITVEKRCV